MVVPASAPINRQDPKIIIKPLMKKPRERGENIPHVTGSDTLIRSNNVTKPQVGFSNMAPHSDSRPPSRAPESRVRSDGNSKLMSKLPNKF